MTYMYMSHVHVDADAEESCGRLVSVGLCHVEAGAGSPMKYGNWRGEE